MAAFDDDPEHDFLTSGAPRCHGKKTNGARCSQPSLRDQNICRFHGGKSPQNLAAAEKKRLDREARKLLGQWDSDPDPIGDPIASLARMAGQAENLKDRAFAACRPGNECSACGRDETDPTAFMAFALMAKQLTNMLVSIDKIGLRDRLIEHNQQQAMILLHALNDAMTEVFPEVDEARLLLQERFRDRVAYWESHAIDMADVVRTQSRSA